MGGSTCGACGLDVPPEARFCPACGTPTAVGCERCGQTLLPGGRFCMACGAPAGGAARVEPVHAVASRRVTSVLFGDLVGFTTLSESRDQEDVRELLSRYFEECRQVIDRYGGSVEKFIGDAVMAVWGVPVALEDDAERSVRAGLELVTAVAALGEELGVPGLALRVGIVTGEVAVTVGASQEGMVAGDAVNTAARVQTVAAPGQVWVDETTRLLSSAAITYVDAGSHLLKGKADPVPLWSVRAVVAAVGGAQRADGLEAPLVGRDRELRLVKELFHRTEESSQPTLLVVDGEAGVGKSRLAWEFEKYVDGLTSTVRWHSGRCVAYGEGVAFFALAEAVRGRLQVVGDDVDDLGDVLGPEPDHDDLTGLLERWLRRYAVDAAERDWLRPRLAALLGVGSFGSYAREDLYSAWVTFFERVGDGDPVTLVVDDAQHADEGLLLFVEHLLRVAGFGCFVVLLTRPGLLEASPTLATNRRSTVVHVSTLGDRDVATLVDGLVAGLPPSVRDQLVRRAEGLPLFAVETVRSLIDRDLVVPRGGQYVLAAPDALDLDSLGAPASLQALISARLDTLTTDQRTLVDRASVLGGSFTPEAITALCADLADPEQTLVELLRLQILARESSRMSAEVGHYRFLQSAVRQVAYGTLSRHDRKALHLAVVAMFEDGGDDADDTASIRAQHYLEAVVAVPGAADVAELRGSALANLRRAAARAGSLGAPGEAARHLRTAATLAGVPAQRGEVVRALAQAECDAGEYDAAIEHALEAETVLAEAGERIEAGRAAAVRGFALAYGRGDNLQATTVAEPWWRELQGQAEATTALLALSGVLTSGLQRLGRDAREVLDVRLALADQAGDTDAFADALSSLAMHYTEDGTVSLVRILLEAAAELTRAQHRYVPLARILNNLCALDLSSDVTQARTHVLEGVRAASTTGNAFLLAVTRANLIAAAWWTGDWKEVATTLADQLPILDPTIAPLLTAFSTQLADAQGRPAGNDYDVPPEAVDDLLAQSWTAFGACVRARAEGDLATAVRRGMEAVEVDHDLSGLWDDLIHYWPVVAQAALDAGDEVALARLVELIDQHGRVPAGLAAHRRHVGAMLDLRAGQDPSSVEIALQEAAGELRQWGSPHAAAHADVDRAWVLDGLGRQTEAAELRARARDLFESMGADAWVAELDAPRRVGTLR